MQPLGDGPQHLRLQHGQRALLMAHRAAGVQLAQALVDHLARRAHQPPQLLLREPQRDTDAAARAGDAESGTELVQRLRESGANVQGGRVFRPGAQPPDVSRHDLQQPQPQGGHAQQQRSKRRPWNDQQPAVFDGADRGGTGLVVEKRELAEDLARPDHRKQDFIALGGGAHHFQATLDDGEQVPGGLSLVHQDLATPAGPLAGEARDLLQLVVGQLGKQPHPS